MVPKSIGEGLKSLALKIRKDERLRTSKFACLPVTPIQSPSRCNHYRVFQNEDVERTLFISVSSINFKMAYISGTSVFRAGNPTRVHNPLFRHFASEHLVMNSSFNPLYLGPACLFRCRRKRNQCSKSLSNMSNLNLSAPVAKATNHLLQLLDCKCKRLVLSSF